MRVTSARVRLQLSLLTQVSPQPSARPGEQLNLSARLVDSRFAPIPLCHSSILIQMTSSQPVSQHLCKAEQTRTGCKISSLYTALGRRSYCNLSSGGGISCMSRVVRPVRGNRALLPQPRPNPIQPWSHKNPYYNITHPRADRLTVCGSTASQFSHNCRGLNASCSKNDVSGAETSVGSAGSGETSSQPGPLLQQTYQIKILVLTRQSSLIFTIILTYR